MGLKLLHVCSVNSAKPTFRMSNLRSPTFQVSIMQISRFQEDQNEDYGSQYLNDTGDGDAKTREEMHVEDDIPEVYGIRSQNMRYLCMANV